LPALRRHLPDRRAAAAAAGRRDDAALHLVVRGPAPVPAQTWGERAALALVRRAPPRRAGAHHPGAGRDLALGLPRAGARSLAAREAGPDDDVLGRGQPLIAQAALCSMCPRGSTSPWIR